MKAAPLLTRAGRATRSVGSKSKGILRIGPGKTTGLIEDIAYTEVKTSVGRKILKFLGRGAVETASMFGAAFVIEYLLDDVLNQPETGVLDQKLIKNDEQKKRASYFTKGAKTRGASTDLISVVLRAAKRDLSDAAHTVMMRIAEGDSAGGALVLAFRAAVRRTWNDDEIRRTAALLVLKRINPTAYAKYCIIGKDDKVSTFDESTSNSNFFNPLAHMMDIAEETTIALQLAEIEKQVLEEESLVMTAQYALECRDFLVEQEIIDDEDIDLVDPATCIRMAAEASDDLYSVSFAFVKSEVADRYEEDLHEDIRRIRRISVRERSSREQDIDMHWVDGFLTQVRDTSDFATKADAIAFLQTLCYQIATKSDPTL